MGDTFISVLAIFLPFFFVMFILHHTFQLKRQRMEVDALEAKARSSDLEERVRVLEKIVTDNNPTLAQEIDSLRALPDVEPQPEFLAEKDKVK